MSRRTEIIVAAALIAILTTAAVATETITYSYDVRGRLNAVVHTGTVNNNVHTNYSYDNADSRTSKITTGAP